MQNTYSYGMSEIFQSCKRRKQSHTNLTAHKALLHTQVFLTITCLTHLKLKSPVPHCLICVSLTISSDGKYTHILTLQLTKETIELLEVSLQRRREGGGGKVFCWQGYPGITSHEENTQRSKITQAKILIFGKAEQKN